MLNRYTKGALICAMLPIGFLSAGCSSMMGEGYEGYHDFKNGHYAEAKSEFTNDVTNRPHSPIAQINIGHSYRQEGDNVRANGMFHEAAASGRDNVPSMILELGGDNHDRVTTRTMACRHLHEDHQLDVNCDDHMVAEIQPAPAVVAEAAPAPVAVEAEATSPPAYVRKQDRN